MTIPSKKTLQTYTLFERIFVGDFINGSPVAHTPIGFQPSLRSLDKVALQKMFIKYKTSILNILFAGVMNMCRIFVSLEL